MKVQRFEDLIAWWKARELTKTDLSAYLYYAMFAHTEQNCRDYLEAVEEVSGKLAGLNRDGKTRKQWSEDLLTWDLRG